MPVPVPAYDRYQAHRVVKPRSDIQSTFPSVAPQPPCDNTLKHVIKSACQPAAVQAGFASFPNSQEIRSNWPATEIFSSGDGAQVCFSRPRVAQESLDFRHGLTAAGDVAISKQVHAEACRSPVRGSDSHLTTMGLQHFRERLGSSESAWASYEADDATCAAGFASRVDAWNFDRGNGPRMYYTKDALTSLDSNQCPGYDVAEQLCDNLLQSATTPFADFVDRIVATEVTHASDHFTLDTLESRPPVDIACRQQQPVTAEPLSNPTYISAYRAMAEPLSEWMADYVWKVCTAGISLPRRFVGAGTPRYYVEKPSSTLAKSIHSVLCSTLLQPSAIVLALWYITRLPVFFDGQTAGVDLTPSELEFRKELYGEGQFYSASGECSQLESRAPFRIALLGCMLANKWLDDLTFSNKTWQSISDVPIQSINRLELTALAALGHDLSVAPKAWELWLAHLRQYQSTVCSYPAPICRPSANDSHAIARKMVMDLAQLHNCSGPKSPSIIAAQPVFSPLLVCDFENKVEPCQAGRFDPFEIDLDEDGPLREEYVPKRRSSATKADAHRRSVSIETKDMMQTSPLLPPPSEWSPHADPPLQRDTRRRGSYLTATVPGLGNASHGRSFSAAYSQASAWDMQIGLEYSGLPFLSHQTDSRTVRPNHGFQSTSFGFPIPVACPPTSHARTTLNSAAPSAQSNVHSRSYSQSQTGGNDNYCLPPVSCSQYVGHPSAFFHGQGDPSHFRPLWLKT